MDRWKFQTKDGRRLTVRPVRRDDAPHLYATASHPEVARTLMLHPAMELAETESFIEDAPPGRHYLVAEIGGRAVGGVTLDQMLRPRLQHIGDVGLMVGRDFWGIGVGGFLMQAILDVADNWLDLKRVELGVFTQNEAAIRLYEKCGFHVEGLRRQWAFGDGGWMDNLLMARLRNVDSAEESAEPPPALESSSRQALTSKPVEGLAIRPPRIEDVEDLHALYSNPLVARTTLQMPSQEIGRTRQRLDEQRPGLYRFVAEMDGRVIGSISLHQDQNPRRRHAAGLGMGVHPDYWGQGIGSALMAATLDLADRWLNIRRVELDVNVDNAAGVRLYQKFGFDVEGTRHHHAYGDGRWADSYFMARIRD